MPPSLSHCSSIAICGILLSCTFTWYIKKYIVLDLALSPYVSYLITYPQSTINWKGLILELLTMIQIQYLHHVQLNNMVSKLGYYNPLPLTTALSSVLYNLTQNATLVPPLVLCKIKQKRMCQSHGILQLPCSLIRVVVLILHLICPMARFGTLPGP